MLLLVLLIQHSLKWLDLWLEMDALTGTSILLLLTWRWDTGTDYMMTPHTTQCMQITVFRSLQQHGLEEYQLNAYKTISDSILLLLTSTSIMYMVHVSNLIQLLN
jgi:hypothetical protein